MAKKQSSKEAKRSIEGIGLYRRQEHSSCRACLIIAFITATPFSTICLFLPSLSSLPWLFPLSLSIFPSYKFMYNGYTPIQPENVLFTIQLKFKKRKFISLRPNSCLSQLTITQDIVLRDPYIYVT